MTSPIATRLSERLPPLDPAVKSYFEREVLPVLTKAREIINESSWAYKATTGDITWNLDVEPNLFISHTVAAASTISIDSAIVLANLRPCRICRFTIYNGSGGGWTPTFSAAFLATAPVIPAGTTATWTFQVKHPDLAVPVATLVEV